MASTQYTAPLVSADTATVVVDADELTRARQDPAVRELHDEADRFLAQLKREKRDF